MMPVKCTFCSGLRQFAAVDNNVLSKCSLCPAGKVANKAHTFCVLPTDPTAAAGSLLQAEAELPSQGGVAALLNPKAQEQLPQDLEMIEEPAVQQHGAGDPSQHLHHEEQLVDFNKAGAAVADAHAMAGHIHEEHSAADLPRGAGSRLISASVDTAMQFQQELAGMSADDNALRFE
jgi:hypothetical protein